MSNFTPIESACSRDFYKAYHSSGTRPLSKVTLIVWHDEEAPSARGAAAYFQTKQSGGSAHLCVDDNECYRCLANEDVPWGAPGANEQGFHIEQAGYAKWSAVIWKKHLNTLRRCAYKTAIHCKLFGIPTVFLYAADLKAGKWGITTHREVSKAFGGTHSDPGPFYPTPVVMWFVRRYYKQL
jgi:N-acetylmuramoyl-L-alanine amidase